MTAQDATDVGGREGANQIRMDVMERTSVKAKEGVERVRTDVMEKTGVGAVEIADPKAERKAATTTNLDDQSV